MYDDPLTVSEFPDGTKLPYSTISYANGKGFFRHFSNDTRVPWIDLRGVVSGGKTGKGQLCFPQKFLHTQEIEKKKNFKSEFRGV